MEQTVAAQKKLLWALLGASYVAAALGFFFMADLTQWIVQAPRAVHMQIFHWRKVLMVLGLACFTAAMYVNWRYRVIGWKGICLNCAVFIPMFVGGFLLVTYIMFLPRQFDAEYVTIREADPHVRRDDEVMVVSIGGDARAFPNKWMRQPHVVGAEIGGEDLVLTYCSLSHLGLAYRPYVNDRKLNLRVFTQLKNNLVMFDSDTGEPIQQITGTTENTGESLEQIPTQMMTYETFRELYPQGKVLFNPARDFRDVLTRMMLRTVINWQHELDKPVFPTIDVDDPGLARLYPKEKVWGVNIDGYKAAYTYDYFKRNNWVLNVELGGQDILLVYYPRLRTVGGFSAKLDGRKVTITDPDQIDIEGNTEQGRLTRISVASEVFWMVWYAFYPDTELFV